MFILSTFLEIYLSLTLRHSLTTSVQICHLADSNYAASEQKYIVMQCNLHKTCYVSLHDSELLDVKDHCHHLVPSKSWIFLLVREESSLPNAIYKRGKGKDKQFWKIEQRALKTFNAAVAKGI